MVYTNNEEGMRQDFHLLERPEGDGPVRVELRYAGDLIANPDGMHAIVFSRRDSNGVEQPLLRYKDLLAWDADGDVLHAWMGVNEDHITLSVDDSEARYPITIDPLSTTATWTGQSNQVSASYGYSVSTAGDVNGDGRSDIIIGAPFYDGGATNGGRAFIYHGTATGPSAIANTTILSAAPEVALGISVSTAGDVNGDGYSDVVVMRSGWLSNARSAYIHHGTATGVSATPSTTIPVDDGSSIQSATTAGDVNGDGYSDLIVGVADYNTFRGRAYVFHGSALGINVTPALTLTGTQNNGYLGSAVSSAGDVNNDGYSDVVIGQGHWTNGQSEEGRFFVHHGSATGVSPTPAFTYESGNSNYLLGTSVSFAGDVNGDGYGDVVVGVPYHFDGTNTVGGVYVFRGSSTGITATGMQVIEGSVNGSTFGYSVCSAGDVNGDGLADVIIGAPGLANSLAGSAFVHLGSASGLGTSPAWTINGASAADRYGQAVAVAGDVNGDGFSDVLVGAPLRESGQTDEGLAFCYLGSADGLQTAVAQVDVTQTNAQFGAAVASAGDVNADGYADVIIGAPLYDNGQTDEGRAHLFLGSDAGFSSIPNWTTESDQAGAQLGAGVGSAGDVNGDGYSDLLIGAPLFDDGETDEGRTYLFNGSATLPSASATWLFNGDQASAQCGRVVSTAGDVNGDGYSDVLLSMPLWDGSSVDEGRVMVFHGSPAGLGLTPTWSTTGGSASLQFGSDASFAGDTDGDGLADVIIGVPAYSNGQSGEGRALLYRGGPTGLASTPAWTFESNLVGAAFGASVSAAGDVNGDGEADFIIGAPGYSNGQTNEGRIYVFYGAPSGPSAVPFTYESGLTNARLGSVVTMAGDVNGDGYGDVAASHLLSNGTFISWLGSPAGIIAVPAYSASGSQGSEGYATAIANAGDVDGDGFGDLIVGSPLYNNGFLPTYVDAGRVRTHRGGGNGTLAHRILQYRSDLSTPVRTGNGTFDPGCSFGVGHVARSWIGRRRMKLAWEVSEHGGVFTGAPMNGSVSFTAQQSSWTDVSSLSGSEIKQIITVSGFSFPKWRVRTRHHPATMIDGQPYGRWHHFGISDQQDPSIKVNLSACGPLPIELISFHATCDGPDVALRWVTASESGNDHFKVQRSDDTVEWEELGTLAGSGFSEQPLTYTYIDEAAGYPLRFYRLIQVDLDGSEHHYPAISAQGCTEQSGRLDVRPVPASEHLFVRAPWPGDLQVLISDAMGRTIRTLQFEDQQQGSDLWIRTVDLAAGRYFLSCWSEARDPIHAPIQITH
ncbi:MAG: FG-GAP-like repeat-containing protein [Flavobacteriales bacterium]